MDWKSKIQRLNIKLRKCRHTLSKNLMKSDRLPANPLTSFGRTKRAMFLISLRQHQDSKFIWVCEVGIVRKKLRPLLNAKLSFNTIDALMF